MCHHPFLSLLVWIAITAVSAPAAANEGRSANVSMPASFEANRGQLPAEVAFRARHGGTRLDLLAGRPVFVSGTLDPDGPQVRIELVGAASSVSPRAEGDLAYRTHHLYGGDPRGWVTDVRHHEAVLYPGVYPGIDLRWRAAESGLKYEFVVAPGADPASIGLRYEGVQTLEVDADGRLVARAAHATLTEAAPIVYQDDSRGRVFVPARWNTEGTVASFELLGEWDPTRPLVIDPYLEFSTYFGGNQYDVVYAVAFDDLGDLYVTGVTRAPDFPVTDRSMRIGGDDVFVGKFASDGMLLYATYIGGTGNDQAWGIDVDATGRATITGWTPGGGFPLAGTVSGATDGFVLRLAPDGASIEWGTYLGGSATEQPYDVALDSAGNAYVVGLTASSDFPTVQAFQDQLIENPAVYAFAVDTFLTKLSPTGTLIYSTYLGSSGFDQAYAVAVDELGRAVVAGGCGYGDFPVDANAPDTTFVGSAVYGEGFIVRFAANDGSVPMTTEFSTFLGGTTAPGEAEYPVDVAIGADFSVYVTGRTAATDFPIVAGAYDSRLTGTRDCTVTRLSADGSTFLYSTYLGGPDGTEGFTSDAFEQPWGITVDDLGQAWVVGSTSSEAFPRWEAGDLYYNGKVDAFVAALSADGSQLVHGTYLGSGEEDVAYDVAFDGVDRIAVVGITGYDYIFPIHAAFDDTHNSHGPDGFVSLFGRQASFVRGDVNHDGLVNIADPILILNFIYGYVADNDQLNLDAADANDSGMIDIADAIYLLQYLNSGGAAPPAPFPACGPDPTPDVLGTFVTDC